MSVYVFFVNARWTGALYCGSMPAYDAGTIKNNGFRLSNSRGSAQTAGSADTIEAHYALANSTSVYSRGYGRQRYCRHSANRNRKNAGFWFADDSAFGYLSRSGFGFGADAR